MRTSILSLFKLAPAQLSTASKASCAEWMEMELGLASYLNASEAFMVLMRLEEAVVPLQLFSLIALFPYI